MGSLEGQRRVSIRVYGKKKRTKLIIIKIWQSGIRGIWIGPWRIWNFIGRS
jgi:hypothetical protein